MSVRVKYQPRIRCLILAAGVVLLTAGGAVFAADTEYEQMIVFVQPDRSAVDDAFQSDRLPAIRKIADAMGVRVHIVPAGGGAPPEVALTPLIVYQNHRGRSIYQGRTTTSDRIRNFIRTSRFISQGAEPNRREQIPYGPSGGKGSGRP
ncbi:MAG: hypothetical protein JJV98_19845 [Desulfosarcina sp.]|nr:hypothetical protein [Desulfobacterales bacterium]